MARHARIARQIGEQLERQSSRAIVDMTRDVAQNLARPAPVGTPRDTEFASSNWIVSEGSPHTGTVGTRNAVTRDPQRRSINRLSSFRFRLFNLFRTPRLFVSNNVDYIGLLNMGSSRQAPAGFVERVIQSAILRFANIRLG